MFDVNDLTHDDIARIVATCNRVANDVARKSGDYDTSTDLLLACALLEKMVDV